MPKPVITVDDVRVIPTGGTLAVPEGAIITDLARELAETRSVKFVAGPEAKVAANTASTQVVAIGSDHGPSFTLKEALKPYLESLGYAVIDCGTYTPESVDYPDIAYAVAQQVVCGKAWRGIIIDGAGIGSSIAANKVPGIRAALCYNEAMAHNSREHNNANVLTLGAGMIGLNLAQQTVKTWLSTEFAGGRHERRVKKIADIEQRFLKGQSHS
jgi:ribose 5-phosphate isomerase B